MIATFGLSLRTDSFAGSLVAGEARTASFVAGATVAAVIVGVHTISATQGRAVGAGASASLTNLGSRAGLVASSTVTTVGLLVYTQVTTTIGGFVGATSDTLALATSRPLWAAAVASAAVNGVGFEVNTSTVAEGLVLGAGALFVFTGQAGCAGLIARPTV